MEVSIESPGSPARRLLLEVCDLKLDPDGLRRLDSCTLAAAFRVPYRSWCAGSKVAFSFSAFKKPLNAPIPRLEMISISLKLFRESGASSGNCVLSSSNVTHLC